MSLLKDLPKPPMGIMHNLTCIQSVLFNDLWLHGSLPAIFHRVYWIDFAPVYFSYNAGAIQQHFPDKNSFNRLLSAELKPDEVAQKYITTTARTARQLVRTAQIVSSPTRWRNSHHRQDLLEDLNLFWDAYEDHMTSLSTFPSVEILLTNSLIDELSSAGYKSEIDAGLPSFVTPSEPNWFALEQQNLAVLQSRFTELKEDSATLDAVSNHAKIFGFVFAPFNMVASPTGMDVIARMKQLTLSVSARQNTKLPDGLPENLARLGQLERELAFWKTERIDVFALADQYAAPMYKALSDLLKLPSDLMFCMTRAELTLAIKEEQYVQIETLRQRLKRHCIALIDGAINFYQPTENDTDAEIG